MRQTVLEPVVLSDANMERFGFTRFYYSNEPEILNGFWRREIEVAGTEPESTTLQQVHIPESMLVPLSRKHSEKLVFWKDFSIISAQRHIEPMKLLGERAGWNQTSEDLHALAAMDPDGNFVATVKVGKSRMPLGTGAVIPAGKVLSWVGMVLVHPEVRRQGIAQAIMERCVAFALLERNTPVNGLDATPMGSKVYHSLGYTRSFRIWRCTIETDEFPGEPESGNILQMIDTKQCHIYEQKRGINERQTILSSLLRRFQAGCFIAQSGSKITGYVMSRPGRALPYVGPLIADSAEIAQELLRAALRRWANLGHAKVYMDTPEFHFQRPGSSESSPIGERLINIPSAHVLADTTKPVREFTRMYQTISKEDVSRLIELKAAKGASNKNLQEWQDIFTRASRVYSISQKHKENETTRVLPYLYAISGPESG